MLAQNQIITKHYEEALKKITELEQDKTHLNEKIKEVEDESEEKTGWLKNQKQEILKLQDQIHDSNEIKQKWVKYEFEMKKQINKVEKLELDLVDEKRINEIKIKTYIDEINLQKEKNDSLNNKIEECNTVITENGKLHKKINELIALQERQKDYEAIKSSLELQTRLVNQMSGDKEIFQNQIDLEFKEIKELQEKYRNWEFEKKRNEYMLEELQKENKKLEEELSQIDKKNKKVQHRAKLANMGGLIGLAVNKVKNEKTDEEILIENYENRIAELEENVIKLYYLIIINQ